MVPSRRGALRALLLILLAARAAHAADRVESGKWESAITADGALRTTTYCITPEEAASLNGDSGTGRDFAERKMRKAGVPCSFRSYEIKGDAVTYTMLCESRTITDKTVYHGQTSDGVKTITKDGQTHEMFIRSRRIGACSP